MNGVSPSRSPSSKQLEVERLSNRLRRILPLLSFVLIPLSSRRRCVVQSPSLSLGDQLDTRPVSPHFPSESINGHNSRMMFASATSVRSWSLVMKNLKRRKIAGVPLPAGKEFSKSACGKHSDVSSSQKVVRENGDQLLKTPHRLQWEPFFYMRWN